jgi:hypothetical protein
VVVRYAQVRPVRPGIHPRPHPVCTPVQPCRLLAPGLKLGVCGEHGGEPESIRFFHQTGLDYVSCSGYPSPASKPAGPPSTNRIVKAFLLWSGAESRSADAGPVR